MKTKFEDNEGFWAVARAALRIIVASWKASKIWDQKMHKLKILGPSSITDKLTSNGHKIIKK